MAKRETQRELRVVKGFAQEPLPTADLEAAENILARLVALAYRADHPDLFTSQGGAGEGQAVRLPMQEVAQQPTGAEVAMGKVLKCAPRGQVEHERTFA